MSKPLTSFKKFLRKQAPIPLITIPHRLKRSVVKEEEEAILEFHAATPANSSKTKELHDRLAAYYNIDAKDKEAIGIFQQYGNHINNSLFKASMPKEEKSKPDPVDHEAEKTSSDAQAAGKKIDALLSAHRAPTADFHVYAGLKSHPFEKIKETQGYEAGEDEPVEAHMPGFTQASLDPNFAMQNVGKEGHVLKLKIKAGSKHGAYVGHVVDNKDAHEFLMRPARKLRIHPKPEDKGSHFIWHGELSD